MPHHEHPQPKELLAFAEGALPDADHAVVEAHVLDCDRCARQLGEFEVRLPDDWRAAANATQATAGISEPQSEPVSKIREQFVPGTVLSERYRIVASLGQGAMGEVYRADDVRLGQTVALKFLAPQLKHSAAAVEYFHREVRLARKISHPNVCRVYDIGEFDENLFLSMEYIDGEDLETLLRRVQTLPVETGIDYVGQICAGLAAAHDCEVLHRDLKPANMMVDSRGRIRITDFGLACLARDGQGLVPAGTPAYMAPEQLVNGETSIQSDLYSVGLVAYEVFTGTRVHQLPTVKQLRQFHAAGTSPSLPENQMAKLPAPVAELVGACLRHAPHDRPRSVAEAARDLPLRTALSLALERGEMPSPEIVAEGVGKEWVSPWAGVGLYVSIVLALVIVLLPGLGRLGGVIHESRFPKSRQELQQAAKTIIDAAGYDQAYTYTPTSGLPFIDNACGFSPNAEYQLASNPQLEGETTPFRFWYRASPSYLFPQTRLKTSTAWSDPGLKVPGEVRLVLNTYGRLVHFEANAPLQLGEPDFSFSWDAFLRHANVAIEPDEFERVEPETIPRVNYDLLFSWSAKETSRGGHRLRIDVAEFQGRPVYFSLTWHQNETTRQLGPILQTQTRLIQLGMLLLAAVLAPLNLLQKRSDPRGALRLAIHFFISVLAVGLIGGHHTLKLDLESDLAFISASRAAFIAPMMWLYYIALEPFVRRFWPTMLITWARAMHGKIHDSLFARDVLVGLAAGIGGQAIVKLLYYAAERFGFPTQPYYFGDANALVAPQHAIANLINCYLLALGSGLFISMFLFALRFPLKTKGVASVIFIAFHTIQLSLGGELYAWGINLVYWTTVVVLLTRLGLVSLIAFLFVSQCVMSFPIPQSLDSWYLTTALLPLLLILAVATFAVYRASFRQLLPKTLATDFGAAGSGP